MALTISRITVEITRVSGVQRGRARMATRVIVLGVMIWGAGCSLSDRSTTPTVPVGLKLNTDFNIAGDASLVRSADVLVDYIEGDSVSFPVNVVDGRITDTLLIEPGELVTITIRAFAANGALIYSGSEGPLTIESGEQRVLNITVSPVVLMLRPGPAFQFAALGNANTVTLSVDVHHVDSLFGAQFRLTWDPAVLSLTGASEGWFLSDSSSIPTIFFVRVENDEGWVACTVTRRAAGDVFVPGRSGSGRLATFMFLPVGAGETEIVFDRGPLVAPKLDKPDGEPIADPEELFIESATVRVTSTG